MPSIKRKISKTFTYYSLLRKICYLNYEKYVCANMCSTFLERPAWNGLRSTQCNLHLLKRVITNCGGSSGNHVITGSVKFRVLWKIDGRLSCDWFFLQCIHKSRSYYRFYYVAFALLSFSLFLPNERAMSLKSRIFRTRLWVTYTYVHVYKFWSVLCAVRYMIVHLASCCERASCLYVRLNFRAYGRMRRFLRFKLVVKIRSIGRPHSPLIRLPSYLRSVCCITLLCIIYCYFCSVDKICLRFVIVQH